MAVYHALAQAGIEVCVCNAAHMRNVPGRKRDIADCKWIAELHKYGLLRASFIPAGAVAGLRARTRYRKKLIEARTSEGQRLAKVLEDAGIKIDSVASKLLGVSGWAMIEALIAGERNPGRLADLALRAAVVVLAVDDCPSTTVPGTDSPLLTPTVQSSGQICPRGRDLNGLVIANSSAQQVVAALSRGGLPCTGGNYNTPVVSGATSETLCDLSSPRQAFIDVFPGTVSKAMVLKHSVSTGKEQIFSVVGPNWWVQVSHPYASRVQAILGGHIIAGPWHPQAQSTPRPSPTLTHSAAPPPAPPPAPTTSVAAPPPASCYPSTNSGNCYEPGEYCRNSDHGTSGVAGDGEKILCEDNNGWRWEPV